MKPGESEQLTYTIDPGDTIMSSESTYSGDGFTWTLDEPIARLSVTEDNLRIGGYECSGSGNG